MWRERRGNKYGAKSALYNGLQFHSKREAAYAAELDLRKKGKAIRDWERQVKIDLSVGDFHICNYYIDFVVTHNDGTKEYVEVKGFATDTWRLKWKLFEALYSEKPQTLLTVVK